MKPLSGREASILALLAQSKQMRATDKKQILETLAGLDDRALTIARVMLGEAKGPAWAKNSADALFAWADGLAPRVA